MSRAFTREDGSRPLVRSTEESAEGMAEVYRGIEPDFDFEVRHGRDGWMIARVRKDGTFESWVEDYLSCSGGCALRFRSSGPLSSCAAYCG